jgi:hypothetical protein
MATTTTSFCTLLRSMVSDAARGDAAAVAALADWLMEQHPTKNGLRNDLLAGADPWTLARVLTLSDDRNDKRAVRKIEAMVKGIAGQVFRSRQDRSVNPEGEFDKQGRWYPSEREDAGGDGSSVRGPSRAFPYSYMLRCRTRQHCDALVRRSAWTDVPADVREAVDVAGLWAAVRNVF